MRRMLRGTVLPAVLLAISAPPASAETLLKLSETARVSVKPDEIVASLTAGADAASAAQAQQQVNAAMARALGTARQVPGVVATTGGYRVWQQPQQQAAPSAAPWHAEQTLDLHGQDGAKMLTLVGALQESGLAVGRLDWQLAPETARRAREEATRAALATLRSRAEDAAGVLGLRFVSFREVRLDAGCSPGPQPRMMVAAAMAAPSAQSENVDVGATVEADAVLDKAP